MAEIWKKFRDRSRPLPDDIQYELLEKFAQQMVEKREGSLDPEIRTRLWDQHARMVETELMSIIRDPITQRFDTQSLKKGQIVHVSLIGLGEVLDDDHYVIVWDVQPNAGHVMVIPLTSKKRTTQEKFNIGLITGLTPPLESVVKVPQLTTISRKSIRIIYTQAQPGHPSIPCQLSIQQLSKVEDLFREYMLKEPCLKLVIEKIPRLMPVTLTLNDRSALYRPVNYIVTSDKLFYKCHDFSTAQSISLAPIQIGTGNRNRLLQKLFSNNLVDQQQYDTEISSHIQTLAHAQVAASVNETNSPTL